MKKALMTILIGIALVTGLSEKPRAGDYKIPYLFEHPRDGKFKTIPWTHEKWDKTSGIHYGGSAFMSTGLNFYLDQKDSKKPILKSGLITFGLGLAKEIEDGFREGFSSRDLVANVVGTASGILIYQGGKWLINKF